MVKILHTADWHLAKILNGKSLLDDQRYILRQIIELTRAEEIDAIIIAGDLYDRSIPPTEAVTLLNDTLYELNVLRKIPIFAISGNHDSAERLAFGSAWYEQNKLFLTSKLTNLIMPIEWNNIQFWLIPYHDALTARAVLQDENIKSFDDAMQQIIAKIKEQQDPDKMQMLVGHTFVAGGVPSDSERVLSVGNVDRVAVDTLADFDYVALGHLHHANALSHPKIQYSGSPLKYSFSEAKDNKSVNIIEIANNKVVNIKKHPLKPMRDLRIIEGYLDELIAHPVEQNEDYLQINLLDEGALIDPIGKLRKIYPNILHLERAKKKLPTAQVEKFEDIIKKDDSELFSQFFQFTKGKNLTTEQQAIIKTAFTKVKGEE